MQQRDQGPHNRETRRIDSIQPCKVDLTNTARKSYVGPHAPTFPLPASNYRNQPNDIWSAELNVRPPKVNICIPNSPRLLDSPQELGAGSCTFEAKQYSAYRFRLRPTPHGSAQPTTERSLIDTDGATPSLIRSPIPYLPS